MSAVVPIDDPLFARAILDVLAHEGAFSNDPADPGGATNWGISLRYAGKVAGDLRRVGIELDVDRDGDIDVDDIRALPRELAIAVYRTQWWDRYQYRSLGLPIARKVFDCAVPLGPSPAHKALQRAARACGRALVDDGDLGPITRAAIAALDDRVLLPALRAELAALFRLVAAAHPALSKFLPGWLNRAYS